MKLDIDLKSGAGPIIFGMTRIQVRSVIEGKDEIFRRVDGESSDSDFFESQGIFVYYDNEGRVEAIEVSSPSEAWLEGVDLLSVSSEKAKKIFLSKDCKAELEEDTVISKKIGLGIFDPMLNEDHSHSVESVIVFAEGYYR
jgi:hypothetical protein